MCCFITLKLILSSPPPHFSKQRFFPPIYNYFMTGHSILFLWNDLKVCTTHRNVVTNDLISPTSLLLFLKMRFIFLTLRKHLEWNTPHFTKSSSFPFDSMIMLLGPSGNLILVWEDKNTFQKKAKENHFRTVANKLNLRGL